MNTENLLQPVWFLMPKGKGEKKKRAPNAENNRIREKLLTRMTKNYHSPDTELHLLCP